MREVKTKQVLGLDMNMIVVAEHLDGKKESFIAKGGAYTPERQQQVDDFSKNERTKFFVLDTKEVTSLIDSALKS